MADQDPTTVDVDVMIIEAGIMANSLTQTESGKALTQKIQDAADAAWADHKPDVTLSVTPFEAGMLLGGLSRSGGQVTGDLVNRLFGAVNNMMRELNIQPLNTPQSTLDNGQQGPAAGLDPSALGLPTDDSATQEQPAQEPAATDSSASDAAPAAEAATEDQADNSSTPQNGAEQ